VEAHAKFNVASAVGIAKAIEPYNPMSYEEPVPPEIVDAMIQMQRATSIPIAGESFHSRGAAQSERAGCLAAHLHLSATLSNFVILEEGNTDPVLNRESLGSWHDSRAYFLPPETPGLGIKLSDAFVREHPVDAGLSKPVRPERARRRGFAGRLSSCLRRHRDGGKRELSLRGATSRL